MLLFLRRNAYICGEDIVEACASFLFLKPEKFHTTQERHGQPLRRFRRGAAVYP